jgi:hypothetical protein
MDAHDRYILTLAMLEGDREARQILADLLEEQGDRGLAQWAREGRNRNRRQLELAIMLLPCATAIELGVEFIEGSQMHPGQQVRGAAECIQFVRDWLAGKRTSQEADDFLRRPIGEVLPEPPWGWQQRSDQYHITREVLVHLRDALSHAARGKLEDPALANKSQRYQYEARLCIRRIASLCWNCGVGRGSGRSVAGMRNWQLERTKAAVLQLTVPS